MTIFRDNITITVHPIANGAVLRIAGLIDGKTAMLELTAAQLTVLKVQVTDALSRKLVDSGAAIIELLKTPPAT